MKEVPMNIRPISDLRNRYADVDGMSSRAVPFS